ncbi:MAG: CHASE domain-containing protein [Sneathiella sp.]|nr:CHASE domain-containing protein [Sneathiella sp.]
MDQLQPAKILASEQRKKLQRSGSMHWAHWSVVFLSIILTIGAWYFAKDQVNEKNREKFFREANQVIELVIERMNLYENALWSAAAFIDANNGEINYEDWLTYSQSLNIENTYPGVNGIGIIHSIKPENLESYIAKERKTRPNYSVHPEHKEAENWPITLIEPALPNKNAIGLDMAFETNRYTSIKKARDTGTAQLTGPITLVQDAKKTPGFLLYVPFYKGTEDPQNQDERREQIVGVTYAPFIMYKLMQGTLQREKRHVNITITDGDDLLFNDNHSGDGAGQDSEPLFRKVEKIELYGRMWKFDIRTNLSFREANANNQPYFILFGGVIIDFLLLGLFIFLSRANRHALIYADQMTEELHIKTRHLEKSNKDLEQFSYLASHDLKSPLNAIKQLVSWIKEDCIEILPKNSKHHLTLLTQRSERMIKLLNDLLDYSRLDKLEHSNETINLKQTSADVFEMYESNNNFKITVPDVVIDIPRIPFEMVLRNLISNAIKHHDEGKGKIEINYEALVDMHKIRVSDDGPGIPENLQAKAMEMFQTLQPRDKVEGSGMGLAIVNKIVDQYSGSVSIEPGTERGLAIVILWPKTNTLEQ